LTTVNISDLSWLEWQLTDSEILLLLYLLHPVEAVATKHYLLSNL